MEEYKTMKAPEFFVVKKKKSPAKAIVITASALVTVGTAAAVAYKYLKNKISTRVLRHVDIDGDGEADVIMLDTTGDGEFDTIILNTENTEEELSLTDNNIAEAETPSEE